ncbi:MAG: HAD family hydrolase [Acidobacteriota bacterium]
MNVDWQRVDLVVFDVDGTLYDQKRLRMMMILLLLEHLVTHPTDYRLLRLLSIYRRCREELAEEECSNIGRLQYERPASQLGVAAQEVEKEVELWIHEKPLKVLRRCRFRDVERVFSSFRDRGRTLAVLSDYPAARKLETLELEVDLCVSGIDAEVDRLKPDPAGLRYILETVGVAAHRALMIGDRDDRDGECARRAGVPFLLRRGTGPTGSDGFSHYRSLLEA